MTLRSILDGDTTTLQLEGHLDLHTAPDVAVALHAATGKGIRLDLEGCRYISSVGLRVLMAAHKELVGQGRTLELTQVQKPVLDILEITGLRGMLRVHPLLRRIDLAGCELLAAGVCGECYRIDDETVVKVYNEGVAPEIAEQEKQLAKAAFTLGLPTALSYDVVTCGRRTGVVYEMLNAELFSRIILRDPEGLEGHAARLADIAHQIHGVRASKGLLPDLKEILRGDIARLDGVLSRGDVDLLLGRLERIPDDDRCVHFDLHTSNIMIRDNEPMLLDLGDLSTGSYLFDLGLLATIYGNPDSGVCERVTRLPNEMGRRLFEGFCRSYFARRPDSDAEFFRRNLHFLSVMRPIHVATFLPHFQETWFPRLKEVLMPLIRAEG